MKKILAILVSLGLGVSTAVSVVSCGYLYSNRGNESNGNNDSNGKDGTNGSDGKDGNNGSDGKDGNDGSDGKDGNDGSDGKDEDNKPKDIDGIEVSKPNPDESLKDWIDRITDEINEK